MAFLLTVNELYFLCPRSESSSSKMTRSKIKQTTIKKLDKCLFNLSKTTIRFNLRKQWSQSLFYRYTVIHRGFNLRPHLFVTPESMAAWLFCLFILHHLCTIQPSRNLADLPFALKSQLSITLRRKKNDFIDIQIQKYIPFSKFKLLLRVFG